MVSKETPVRMGLQDPMVSKETPVRMGLQEHRVKLVLQDLRAEAVLSF
jgi:hypothetical protein